MNVLDVFILKFNDDELSNSVYSWCISIIYEVFGSNFIPSDCTHNDIKRLENKILSLSPSRQAYLVDYLIDCEYNLEDKNASLIVRLLRNFTKYTELLDPSVKKTISDIPSLEERYKMKIFITSDDFNIKKIRKEKLLKINII